MPAIPVPSTSPTYEGETLDSLIAKGGRPVYASAPDDQPTYGGETLGSLMAQGGTPIYDKPWTNDLKEVGRQLGAGAAVELPRVAGQALKWTSEPGRPVYQAGERLENYAKSQEPGWEPDLEGRGPAAEYIIKGARQVVPSMAGMAPALAVAPFTGGGSMVPWAVGALSGGALAGASQAQEDYESAIKQGIPEDQARRVGWKTGGIEALGETAGDLAGGAVLGLGGRALSSLAKTGVQGAIDLAAKPAVLKPFAKALAGEAVVEPTTEFGQNYGEAAVRQAAGMAEPETPYAQGMEGAKVALGMVPIFGMFGLGGHIAQSRHHKYIGDVLKNPESSPQVRAQAAEFVGQHIDPVDAEAGRQWRLNAVDAIASRQPIDLTEEFARRVGLPAPLDPIHGKDLLTGDTIQPETAEPAPAVTPPMADNGAAKAGELLSKGKQKNGKKPSIGTAWENNESYLNGATTEELIDHFVTLSNDKSTTSGEREEARRRVQWLKNYRVKTLGLDSAIGEAEAVMPPPKEETADHAIRRTGTDESGAGGSVPRTRGTESGEPSPTGLPAGAVHPGVEGGAGNGTDLLVQPGHGGEVPAASVPVTAVVGAGPLATKPAITPPQVEPAEAAPLPEAPKAVEVAPSAVKTKAAELKSPKEMTRKEILGEYARLVDLKSDNPGAFTPELEARMLSLREQGMALKHPSSRRSGVDSQPAAEIPKAIETDRSPETIQKEINALEKRMNKVKANAKRPLQGSTRSSSTTVVANLYQLARVRDGLLEELASAKKKAPKPAITRPIPPIEEAKPDETRQSSGTAKPAIEPGQEPGAVAPAASAVGPAGGEAGGTGAEAARGRSEEAEKAGAVKTNEFDAIDTWPKAQAFLDRRYKEYGGKGKYRSSQEYKEIYPKIRQLNSEHRRQENMKRRVVEPVKRKDGRWELRLPQVSDAVSSHYVGFSPEEGSGVIGMLGNGPAHFESREEAVRYAAENGYALDEKQKNAAAKETPAPALAGAGVPVESSDDLQNHGFNPLPTKGEAGSKSPSGKAVKPKEDDTALAAHWDGLDKAGRRKLAESAGFHKIAVNAAGVRGWDKLGDKMREKLRPVVRTRLETGEEAASPAPIETTLPEPRNVEKQRPTEERTQKAQEEVSHAEQKPEATPVHGGGGAQSEVRQASGHPAVSGGGVRESGPGEGEAPATVREEESVKAQAEPSAETLRKEVAKERGETHEPVHPASDGPKAIEANIEKGAEHAKIGRKRAGEIMLAELDKAIAAAPTIAESDWTLWKGGYSVKASAGDSAYVTIDVPGDGKYKLANVKDRLQAFRKKVAASYGFGGTQVPTFEPGNKPPKGYETSTGSAAANRLIKSSVEDGDKESALETAAAADMPLAFVKTAYEGANIMINAEPVEIAPGVDTVVGEGYIASDREWVWEVIETSSGAVLGTASMAQEKNVPKGKTARQTAIDVARKRVQESTKSIDESITSHGRVGQEVLKQRWLKGDIATRAKKIMDQSPIESNLGRSIRSRLELLKNVDKEVAAKALADLKTLVEEHEGSVNAPEAAKAAKAENGKPAAEESTETAQARADLQEALKDLAHLALDSGFMGTRKAAPSGEWNEAKLVPILTRLFDAAFRLGYHKFKDAARFALSQVREHVGDAAADAITLDHAQGAYIAMAGKYRDKGADSKKAVVDVESLEDILNQEAGAEMAPVVEEPAAKSEESTHTAQTPKSKPKRTAQPAASKSSHEAGEELKANKRNKAKGLTWANLDEMNESLRVRETTKANIWPKPDYAELIQSGMSPLIARIYKQVYDGVASAPRSVSSREAMGEQALKSYYDGVQRVREGLDRWSRDPDMLRAFVKKNARFGGMLLGKEGAVELSAIGATVEQSLLDVVYPEGWRAHRAEVHRLGGNKLLAALQPGFEDLRRAVKDIEKGWPNKREAWQVQGYRIARAENMETYVLTGTKRSEGGISIPIVKVGVFSSGSDPGWQTELQTFENVSSKDDPAVREYLETTRERLTGRYLLVNKRGRVAGDYASQEEAENAARETTRKEGKEKPDERGIALAQVERVGEARRLPDEHVSAEQVKETFGLRGVNMGNWVPNDERQAHLDHAYDALLDLADVLGVPPKAISLNGMLGLAIGAQGSGKAAAHFVPGVNEINLTRTAGAGSLAHEWAHALDHYFGVKAGLAGQLTPYLTTARGKVGEGVRTEIAEAFKTLVETMRRRPVNPEAWARREAELRESGHARLSHNVESWLKSMRRNFAEHGLGEEFDKLADRVQAGDYGDGHIVVGRNGWVSPVVEDIRKLYKTKTGRLYSKDDSLALQSNIDGLQYYRKNPETEIPQDLPDENTPYLSEALLLDKGKSKPYWSTPWEMFARAMDVYVSSRLEEAARKNSYLSHSGRMDETVPKNEDRVRINGAFKALFDAVQTRETEGGNVELYSKAGRTTQGMTPEAATAWLRKNLGRGIDKWLRSGRLTIARDMDEARRLAGDAGMLSVPAWHGSPYDFDRFQWDRIGTGEAGTAGKSGAYGYGHYFASMRAVAESYKESVLDHAIEMKHEFDTGGFHYYTERGINGLNHYKEDMSIKDPGERWQKREVIPRSKWKSAYKQANKLGEPKLFQVSLAPDHDDFLDFDKPLSDQSEQVKRGVAAAWEDNGLRGDPLASMAGWDGELIYHALSNKLGGDEAASVALLRAGVPGNTYLDQQSRGKGEGSHNYVVFSDDLIDIQAKFSKAERRSMDRVVPARDKQGRLLAPNGKPSKLNEMQWRQVRTPEFKAWFGDWEKDRKNASKVVDPETKEPMVVYHGTGADFSIFDRSKSEKGPSKAGFWFADDPGYAEMFGEGERNLMPGYLNLRNPLVLNQGKWDRLRASHGGDAEWWGNWRAQQESMNYDGVLVKPLETPSGNFVFRDPGVFAAFDAIQIKSAIGNTGAFSPTDPDIRRSATPGMVEGFTVPGKGGKPSRVVLVAEGLSPSSLRGVALHELFHAAVQDDPALGKRLDRLMAALERARDGALAHPDTEAGRWVAKALARVRQAETRPEHELEEMAAYAISEYERAPESLPARIRAWVRNLLATIRMALFRAGVFVPKNITPADLSALAKSWLRRGAAEGSPSTFPLGEGLRASELGLSEKPFYSALTRAVEGLAQAKGSAAQWRGMIKNLPGVKSEEVEWSGVNEWLDAQTGPVTKAALMEYLKAQEVEVKPVSYGVISKEDEERMDALARQEKEIIDDLYNKYGVGYETLKTKDEDERLKAIKEEYKILAEKYSQKETKYGQYTEEGGKPGTYREVVLTLPVPKKHWLNVEKRGDGYVITNDDGAEVGTIDSTNRGDWLVSLGVLGNHRFATEDEAVNYPLTREVESKFVSGHFDEPNIVAHVRYDERESQVPLTEAEQRQKAERERLLKEYERLGDELGKAITQTYNERKPIKERIKSELLEDAKAGKINFGDITNEEIKRWADLPITPGMRLQEKLNAEREALWKRIPPEVKPHLMRVYHMAEIQSDWHQEGRKKGYAGSVQLTVKSGGQYWDIYDNNDKFLGTVHKLDAVNEEQAKKIFAERQQQGLFDNPVPNAPFKQSWPLLGFKHVLRSAVENGLDAVTWDVGATQVKRYEDAMRQAVDKVEWTRNLAGDKIVTADKRGASVFAALVNAQGVIDNARPDGFMGKSVDDVFGKALGKRIMEEEKGAARGDGLTIGGQGMEGFYDQILPAEVGKFVKKWGGKVEKTTVSGDVTAWEVKITPDMRNAAMEGLPMFSKADGKQLPANENGDFYAYRGAKSFSAKSEQGVYFTVDPWLAYKYAGTAGKVQRVTVNKDRLIDVRSLNENPSSEAFKRLFKKHGINEYAEFSVGKKDKLTHVEHFDLLLQIAENHGFDGFIGYEGGSPSVLLTPSANQRLFNEEDIEDKDVVSSEYWAPGQVPKVKNNREQGQRSMDQVVPVRDAAGRLLAPNGKPSKLNEMQWRQVRTPEFRAWFGDWEHDPANASKVVDENGEPLVVYHGSPSNDFNVFDTQREGTTTFIGIPIKVQRYGLFFAENKEFAETFASQGGAHDGHVKAVFLRIKEPLYLLPNGVYWKDINRLVDQGVDGDWLSNYAGDPRTTWEQFEDASGKKFSNQIKSAGYDGVAMSEINTDTEGDEDVWIAFDPTQIKSATGNTGAFSPENPDIRYSMASPEESDQNVVDQAREYGIEVESNADGSITLYHGASKQSAQAIERAGRVDAQTYFSHSPDVTGYNDEGPRWYATVKNKGGRVLAIHVDPSAVSFASGTGEFYAEEPLSRDKDGVWRAAGASTAKAGRKSQAMPVVQDVYGDQIKVNGQWYHAERVLGKPASEFSVGDPVPQLAGRGDIRFSIASPEKVAQAIDDSMRTHGGGGELRRAFRQGWNEAKGTLKRQSLALLTPLQLVEVSARLLPGMKNIAKGFALMERDRLRIMAGDRHAAHETPGFEEVARLGADGIADLHSQLPDSVKDHLADVQHEATIYGLTPAEEFKPLIDGKEAAKKIAILRAEMKQRGGQEQFPVPGPDWTAGRPVPGVRTVANLMEEERQLKRQLAFERVRAREKDRVQDLYDALPDEAKRVYKLERDFHRLMSEKIEKALVDLIELSDTDRKLKDSSIAKLRKDFEAQRVTGDYFPLFRQGDYWLYLAGKETPGEKAPLAVEYVNAQQIKVTSTRGFKRNEFGMLRALGGRFIKPKDESKPGFFVLPADRMSEVENRFRDQLEDSPPGEGQREFYLFRTEEERREAEARAAAQGRTVLGSGKKTQNLREMEGVSGQFVGQVEDLLSQLGTSPEVAAVQDAIWQMYLQTLPEMSSRKHSIHRNKTPGYGRDTLKSFAHKAAHDAYGYGRLKNAPLIRREMNEIKKDIEAAESPAKWEKAKARVERLEAFKDEVIRPRMTKRELNLVSQSAKNMATPGEKTTAELKAAQAELQKWEDYADIARQWGKEWSGLGRRVDEEIARLQQRIEGAAKIRTEERGLEFASNVYDEMQLAVRDAMQPRTSPWAVAMNQIGYVWALALSPAAWATNALQTPLKSMPYVASKFGMGKTTAAFNGAYAEVLKNKGDVSEALQGEEAAAYKIAEDTGRIDNTRAHDLWGFAEEGKGRSGWARKWSAAVGFGFHQTEKVNREVAYLAAFRLARESMEFEPAVDYALHVVDKTHLNYTAMNRARVMRPSLARVALQFKTYSQGMLYLWLHSAYSVFKGASPQERAEARRYLLMQAGVQIAAAGLMGLPVGALWMIAEAALTGDDDDPWDFEGEFRQAMADFLGTTGGRGASKGLLNMVGPADLHSRLSERDLVWRDSDRDLEGRDALSNWITNLAGPAVGVIGNMLDGVKLMGDGHFERGIEKIMPKAVASLMKAGRYAISGAKTLKGDTLVPDVGVSEIVAQALGFTPARIAERYDENRATMGIQKRLLDRRQELLTRMREAFESGDEDEKAKARAEIQQWNRLNRERAIRPKDVRQSARMFAKNRATAVDGMVLDRKLRNRLDRRYEFGG